MLPDWMRRLKAQLRAGKVTGPRTGARASVRRSESICTLNDAVNSAEAALSYTLKRSSARRTLALQVREAGRIVVQAPGHTPLSEVEGFIRQHLPWLRARLEASARRDVVWNYGMALPFMGGSISLNWQDNGPIVPRMDSNSLYLCGSWPEAPARVRAWYHAQAAEILPARLAVQAARMGVAVPPLRLSDARTRWGSLSAQGRMGLNWRLVMLSEDLIDYVICHELAHLRQHNHSPAFWREVEALYPDYRSARIRLRHEGGVAMALGFDAVEAVVPVPIPEP